MQIRFMFSRRNDKGVEENSDEIEAPTLEEATQWAEGFCQRHKCAITLIEWYDEETKRWQKSRFAYC